MVYAPAGRRKASFDTIIASGWRGALPHGKTSDKIVAAGEFVTLDFGALYQGYCSDMTRTLLVNGEGVSAESHPLFNVYQIVLRGTARGNLCNSPRRALPAG